MAQQYLTSQQKGPASAGPLRAGDGIRPRDVQLGKLAENATKRQRATRPANSRTSRPDETPKPEYLPGFSQRSHSLSPSRFHGRKTSSRGGSLSLSSRSRSITRS